MVELDAITNPTNCRLFVPISLGNHYYSTARLSMLLKETLIPSAHSTVFLCDRLRVLSYIIRGEEYSEGLRMRVELQLQQQIRTLNNIGYSSYPNIVIKSWSDIEADTKFLDAISGVKSIVARRDCIQEEIYRMSDSLVSRFGSLDHGSDRSRSLQMEYLVLESALSLYMNEIIGFDYEVYRKGIGLIDYIYDHASDDLLAITSGRLNRKLVSLELMWGERS